MQNFNCMFLAVEHTKKKMNNYQEEEEVEVVPNAWSSELPMDLLGLITVKIRSSFPLPEFIRFGSVCLGWRYFSIENYQHIKLPDKVPLLIIPIPPSLLVTDYQHQNKIFFPPSSSSSSSDEEDYEEEEEEKEVEEKKKEELVVVEVEEEEKDEEDLEDEEEEKEKEEEEEEEKAEEDLEEEDLEEEEEDEEEEEHTEWESYYNLKGMWRGQRQGHEQRLKSTRNFYSLSEKMVYHDFPLPVPYYKNIRGSSYGWLVTVEECFGADEVAYLTVRLLNPFRTNNNEIELPPFTDGNPLYIDDHIDSSYYLVKAFLSANPSSLSDPTTELVVLGVYGFNRLAFCRPCDKAWTPLVDLEAYRPIQDIICYNDQFYAILQNGYVFAFVFDAAQPLPTPIVTVTFLPPPVGRAASRYLVESEGDLLQVQRNNGSPTPAEIVCPTVIGNYITREFLVFKLDPMGQWVEMKTLNNRMLFIGTSSSMSLSALDFPGWSRPNSIYYTDDYIDGYATTARLGPHDIGIFNLEDGSFERHYEAESKPIMPPPTWIQPML